MPVFTLEVLTWLMRFSCSGFTNTTTLMFHSDCMATCWGGGGGGGTQLSPHRGTGTAAAIGLPPHGTRSRHGPKGGRGDPNGGTTP